MQALAASCEELRARTGNPPLGINYFADLRLTFRQIFFLQNWFRNEFGVGLV